MYIGLDFIEQIPTAGKDCTRIKHALADVEKDRVINAADTKKRKEREGDTRKHHDDGQGDRHTLFPINYHMKNFQTI
ncbi:MAG: hypothetical protein IJO58_06150 [Clostridia bacterium]|nr:hypothetical protein [Clostridia bacterium]